LGLFTFALRHRPDGLKTLLPLMGAIFSFFYVVLCFNFVTRILFFFEGSEETAGNGAYFVLFLVAATKFTDMGAYLLGSMIGKHKMIPHISPGKTWQGLVGGFLGAIGGAFLIRGLCSERLAALGWGHALVLAVILGAAAVVGDLAESILKRSLEVKDSGAMLPGIGGALDLIDSLCFTAPLLYLYLVLFAV
ncbi:MAG: CDP-archaeol synthase, partial [Verrucomicrobiota bacterium]